MKCKSTNLRSQWEFGEASEARKGLMLGMGYSLSEIERPLIGIVNSWNEYNPGHVHLEKIAERVKQGVREAGGLPLEVMTTAICDGMVLKDPKYIEIPSRNSIADQVEITVEGNLFDGMVLLSTCDSIVPGHLMAAARLNIPSLMVTGGYMPTGHYKGSEVSHKQGLEKVGAFHEGRIEKDEYDGLMKNCWGICGACPSMTTANSMCMMAEALGMTLPGNSNASAVGSRLRSIAYEAGKQIMYLVENNITARQIMSPEAIMNAIKVNMAVAGSSNLILHLPAIAYEAGYDSPWWKYFDEASGEVPLLTNLTPSGPYGLKEFDMAGGMPALLCEMLSVLNKDCLTVTGETIETNVKDMKTHNTEVIRGLDNPVKKEPGIGVLYGNLAPEGAIVKIAAIPDHLMEYKGKAKVFDSLQDSLEALRNGRICRGDAIVIRFLGLKGRFGTTAYPFQEELKGRKELYNSCAIITDGRYSGASSGLSIGYVSPEAALKGPLCAVQDGDEICIDISNRKISISIDDEEMQKRIDACDWKYDSSKYKRFLNTFVKNVGSMAKGGIWED